ncbi:MAG TPA: hypothetical protein VF277_09475, partial [Steroidobacteraceae bacterium]
MLTLSLLALGFGLVLCLYRRSARAPEMKRPRRAPAFIALLPNLAARLATRSFAVGTKVLVGRGRPAVVIRRQGRMVLTVDDRMRLD